MNFPFIKKEIMKKIVMLFLLLSFISCETDKNGGCDTSSWIGTYTIETPNGICNNTLDVVQVSGNTITLNGVEGQHDGCNFIVPTFQVEATLDGSSIEFSGLSCIATYKKN